MKVKDIKSKAISIKLDKPRTLKFDLNSFAELEDRYNSMEEAMAAIESGSIKGIRTFLWCGLIHEDEGLTERQVGAMIDISDLAQLSEKITAAIGIAMPEPELPTQIQGNLQPSQ